MATTEGSVIRETEKILTTNRKKGREVWLEKSPAHGAYERVWQLPPIVVLGVLWLVGVLLITSVGAALYFIAAMLVRAVLGA